MLKVIKQAFIVLLLLLGGSLATNCITRNIQYAQPDKQFKFKSNLI